MIGPQNLETGHVTLTTPIFGIDKGRHFKYRELIDTEEY